MRPRVGLAGGLALMLVLIRPDLTAAPVAVVGARLHPISSPVIEDGILVFTEDRIDAIGSAGTADIPPGAEVIDASGLDLWPGMIDAQTSLGLVEIGSVRGTRDQQEVGAINPNVRAEIAVNPASELIPVARANGVLLAATLPSGTLVAGTSAVMVLDGWTVEEMVRQAPAGLVIHWPDMRPKRPDPEVSESKEEPEGIPDWEQKAARLSEMCDEARAYRRAREVGGVAAHEADVCWSSLGAVLTGETPVWVVAGTEAQIRAALRWTAKESLRMVLLDGGDAWRCAGELAARDVPVITSTIRLPRRHYEPYDTPFSAPARLHAAGVRVCFASGGSANVRNLPSEAARAVAWGLPREIGERGLTLTPAEILGIADRYGSLEPGKSATFILVEGDLLETRMQVRRAWIDGVERSLENRHTQLAEKYRARPRP